MTPEEDFQDLGVRFWEDEKPDVGFCVNAASRYILETVTEPSMELFTVNGLSWDCSVASIVVMIIWITYQMIILLGICNGLNNTWKREREISIATKSPNGLV